MYSLQRRLKNTNISITSVHPGDVDTEIGRDYVDSKTWQLLLRFSRLIGELKSKNSCNGGLNLYKNDIR